MAELTFQVISESVLGLDEKATYFAYSAVPAEKIISLKPLDEPEVDNYQDVYRVDGSDATRYVMSYSQWFVLEYEKETKENLIGK